jgi:aromatic-amino-acid transaminase
MTSSVLEKIEMAPKDPILGVTEAYNADQNPKKVNLGVGVYTDDNGKVPVLQCVRKAEQKLAETAMPRNYLPIDGLATYDRAVQETLFGADNPVLKAGRIVTAQTLGGTGGLKVGGDFLRRVNPKAEIYISDPSWENHRAIFEYAGYTVKTYPYYDPATHGLNFDGMLGGLDKLPAGAIVLLHACCHNPTGVDLTADQWEKVIAVVNKRGLVPFLDIAYQGFAEGLEADAVTIRRFTAECPVVFVSSSFSKSLSLYGERVHIESAKTRHPHQLLQSADPWRPGGGDGAGLTRTAPDVGPGTGPDARPHQDHAQAAGRQDPRAARRF